MACMYDVIQRNVLFADLEVEMHRIYRWVIFCRVVKGFLLKIDGSFIIITTQRCWISVKNVYYCFINIDLFKVKLKDKHET